MSTTQNASDGKGKLYRKTNRRFENQRHVPTERRLYGNYVPHNSTPAPMEAKAAAKAVITNTNRSDRNVKELPTEVIKNGDIGSDGEFQTVAPKHARRKEKLHMLKEHREHIEPQPYRHKDKQRLHGRIGESIERPHKDREHNNFNAKDGSKDKDKDKDKEKEKEREKEDCESAEESEQVPIKYVEAPLPVVNPWTKSKVNAPQPVPEVPTTSVPVAPVVAAPIPAPVAPVPVPVPTPVEKPLDKEKRVLQPQVPRSKVGEFLVMIW